MLPLVPVVVLAAGRAATILFISESIDEMSWPWLMDCSMVWNCANWVTNCVLSAGFVGSWFCSCATNNCRNISSVTGAVVALLALLELLFAAEPDDVVRIMLELIPDFPSSCRRGGAAYRIDDKSDAKFLPGSLGCAAFAGFAASFCFCCC